MNLRSQRRIAAVVLKKGQTGVWVDPEAIDDVSLALTRSDIRKLVHDKKIKPRQPIGVSKGRFRHVLHQKKRGHRKGQGSRKGKAGARQPEKQVWIHRIRAQRRYLAALRDLGQLERSDYRSYYLKAKGGAYRSVNHLSNSLIDAGVIKKQTSVAVRR